MNKSVVNIIECLFLKGQSNTEKCSIDYITYKQSTIFHHNFSIDNIDSAGEGFFINKKYPAIVATVSF